MRTYAGGNPYPFTRPGNVFAVVNYCLAYEMECPSGVGILRMPGKRIATPVCGLVRNDRVFVTIRADFYAESKITMSLRGAAVPARRRRGNPFPRNAKHCVGHGPTSIFQVNYNLPQQQRIGLTTQWPWSTDQPKTRIVSGHCPQKSGVANHSAFSITF